MPRLLQRFSVASCVLACTTAALIRRNHTTRQLGFALFVKAILFATRRAYRFVVHGPSMIPTLNDGDRVLVVPVRQIFVGDLIVFRDHSAEERQTIKRVAKIDAFGIFVLGDNGGASRDSREIGLVAQTAVLGLVWYRYFPPKHARRILFTGARAARIDPKD